MKSILQLFILFLFISCGSNSPKKETPAPLPKTDEPVIVPKDTIAIPEEEVEDYTPLIFSVQLGISPQRPNWVLFENGSYVLLKNPAAEDKMSSDAITILRRAVDSNKHNSGTTVKKSQLAKGWIVTFGNSGVYNYVDPKTLNEGINPDEIIIEKARLNIAMDYNNIKVIKVHK